MSRAGAPWPELCAEATCVWWQRGVVGEEKERAEEEERGYGTFSFLPFQPPAAPDTSGTMRVHSFSESPRESAASCGRDKPDDRRGMRYFRVLYIFTLLCCNQPIVFFSYTKPAPATSTSQPTVLFSHNKSASATSHSQPNSVIITIHITLCSSNMDHSTKIH